MLMWILFTCLALAVGEPARPESGGLKMPAAGIDLTKGSRYFDVHSTSDGRFWVGAALPLGLELTTQNGRELMFVRAVRGHGARLLGYIGFYSLWEQGKPGRTWSARYVRIDGQRAFEIDLSPYLQRKTLLDASFAGDRLLLGLWDDTVDPEIDGCDQWGQCAFWGIFELEVFAMALGGEPPLMTVTRESTHPIALPDGLTLWFEYTKSRPADRNDVPFTPHLSLGAHSRRSDKTESMTLSLPQDVKNPRTIRAEVNSVIGMPLVVFFDGGDEIGRAWVGVADNGKPRLESAPGNECIRLLGALDRLVLVKTPKRTAEQRTVQAVLKELRGGHETDWLGAESLCKSLGPRVESKQELDMDALKPLFEKLL